MTNRRSALISVIALAAVSAGAFVYTRSTRGGTNGSVVRVAALLNLTGPAARFDAIKKQALDLALERIKAQRPELKLELTVVDAGGAPDITLAAARKAIDNGASYILTGTSPTALAVAGIARGRTPAIVQIANAANPAFGPPRPGEYRFWPDWNQEAKVVADQLRANGIRSVVVVHSADPYSEALRAAFVTLLAAEPAVAVRAQQYDPASTPDFRPLLLRAKDEGVGALIVFGLPPGIKALMGQLVDVAWTAPIVGGVNTNLTIDDYDKSGLKCGLWVVETEAMKDELPKGSEAEAFRTSYREKFGAVPPFHALYMADALYFAAAAVSSTAAPVATALDRASAVREFAGPSGTIRIGNDGVLQLELKTRKVR
jgi:ABC-type branched-subunit amino acid transport system substrate-binding protein